jgi:predicted ester cyclase
MAVIDEVCTADFVYHDPSGPVQGREAFKQFIGMYLSAFPDFHITIEDMVAEGDRVAVRQTTTATHQGIPPTGKRITVSGIHITRVVDGKSVEDWGNDDVLGLMQQLGVIR